MIDDDLDLSKMIQFLLETKGFSVTIANDGAEGLAQVKILLPDLVLLDLNMPKIGGIEFCHQIRSDAGNHKPRIIILTARANIEETLRQIEVDGFLTKPFEIKQLLAEINRVFR